MSSLVSVLLFVAASLAFPTVSAAQMRDSTLIRRVAWLRQHAIPIRSIDPGDTNFSDLQPILRALRGVRVVLLGEQTHADGATFDAKARLVHFLHQDARFGLLAFEANEEVLREADERLPGTEPTSIVAGALPAMWGETETVRRLLTYARTTRETRFPLHIAGFDVQLFGRWDVPRLYRRTLDRLVASVAPPLVGSEDVQRVDSILSFLETGVRGAVRWPPPKFVALDRHEYDRMLEDIAGLRTRVSEAEGDTTGAAMAQLLRLLDNLAWGVKNVDRYVHRPEAGWTAVRDRAMADNLLWLVRRHPDEGVVAWGHWAHIAKTLRVIDVLNSGLVVQNQEPMGEYVSTALHDEAYAIGFLAFGGAHGQIFPDTAYVTNLPEPPKGSLDWLLAQVGAPYLFLDLRSVPKDHWLRRALVARPGYKNMKAIWPDIFDAVVFTRTMYPIRRQDALRGK